MKTETVKITNQLLVLCFEWIALISFFYYSKNCWNIFSTNWNKPLCNHHSHWNSSFDDQYWSIYWILTRGYNHRVSVQLNVCQLPRASAQQVVVILCEIWKITVNSHFRSDRSRTETDRQVSISYIIREPGGTGVGWAQSIIQQLFYHLQNNNTGDDGAIAVARVQSWEPELSWLITDQAKVYWRVNANS